VLDSKADLVVFGMGEDAILEIACRLADGESVSSLREMRGVAYALGASEIPPSDALVIPSYDEVRSDKTGLCRSDADHPHTDQSLQCPATRSMARAPGRGLQSAALSFVSGLAGSDLRPPLFRRPDPSYREPIPAYEMIKDSVTIMRGCFGGCTFCSITATRAAAFSRAVRNPSWKRSAA